MLDASGLGDGVGFMLDASRLGLFGVVWPGLLVGNGTCGSWAVEAGAS
jgi:hypothetical protein